MIEMMNKKLIAFVSFAKTVLAFEFLIKKKLFSSQCIKIYFYYINLYKKEENI